MAAVTIVTIRVLSDVGTARLMRIVFLIADVADVDEVFGLFK